MGWEPGKLATVGGWVISVPAATTDSASRGGMHGKCATMRRCGGLICAVQDRDEALLLMSGLVLDL